MNGIDKAIALMGGQTALARYCGVQPQAVQQWKCRGAVPAKRVLQIEAATGGAVSRTMLRPDLYPMICPFKGGSCCKQEGY